MWRLLASLCKVTSFKGDMSGRLIKASPPKRVPLRRLVLPPTKSSTYNVAKTMRNVPFMQIYPTRAFANPIIRFCMACWPREKLVVLFLRLWIISFHKKTGFYQFNLCVCRKPSAQYLLFQCLNKPRNSHNKQIALWNGAHFASWPPCTCVRSLVGRDLI